MTFFAILFQDLDNFSFLPWILVQLYLQSCLYISCMTLCLCRVTVRDALCLLVLLLTILVFIIRRYYFQSKKPAVFIDGKVGHSKICWSIEGKNCWLLSSLCKQLWWWWESTLVCHSSFTRNCRVKVCVLIEYRFQPIHCVIYTGDTVSKEEILETTRVLVCIVLDLRRFSTSISNLRLV